MSYLGKYEQRATNIKRFDVTSSTSATHTLTWVPPNEQSIIVTINGIKQHEDAYSVSGTTLTLTSALITTDKLEVIGIQDVGVGMVPADGVVKNVHINASAAIAKTKLASLDIVNADVNASAAIALSKLATDPSNASNLASGTVPTARLGSGTADATTFLRGDNAWASAGGDNTPAFMAVLEGSDTVSSGGVERINFNVEKYDTDNAYDNTTNYRFTVPAGEGGAYMIFFQVMIEDADNGYDIDHLEPQIRVNGTARWAFTDLMNSSLERRYFTVHGGPIILALEAADYVDCACYVQTSNGGDLKFVAGGSGASWYGRTYFCGYKLIGVS